jgi:hypothetical protein
VLVLQEYEDHQSLLLHHNEKLLVAVAVIFLGEL